MFKSTKEVVGVDQTTLFCSRVLSKREGLVASRGHAVAASVHGLGLVVEHVAHTGLRGAGALSSLGPRLAGGKAVLLAADVLIAGVRCMSRKALGRRIIHGVGDGVPLAELDVVNGTRGCGGRDGLVKSGGRLQIFLVS